MLVLVCSHCLSQFIVDDKEFVTLEGWVSRPRCMKCGRDKFKEVVKSPVKNSEKIQASVPAPENTSSSPLQLCESLTVKQGAEPRARLPKPAQQPKKAEEIDNADYKPKKEGKKMAQCKTSGCSKWAAVHGYCIKHFETVYGITAADYRAHKRSFSENPLDVAERIRQLNVEVFAEKVDQADKDRIRREAEEEAQKRERERGPEPAPTTADDVVVKPINSKMLQDALKKALPDYLVVAIDPELAERLAERAKWMYRTTEQQANYYIAAGLRKDEGKKTASG